MHVCANYLCESDQEEERSMELCQQTSTHLLTHIITSCRLCVISTLQHCPVPIVLLLQCDSSALIQLSTFSCLHAFVLQLQFSACLLSFGSQQGKKRKEIPLGMFLRLLSCVKNC